MPDILASNDASEDLTKAYLAEILERTRWSQQFACRQLAIQPARFRQLSAGRPPPATEPEWSSIRTLRAEVLEGRFRPDPSTGTPQLDLPIEVAAPAPQATPEVQAPPAPTPPRVRTRRETKASPRVVAEFHAKVFEACGGDPATRSLDPEKLSQVCALIEKSKETVQRWALGSQHPRRYKIIEIRNKLTAHLGNAPAPITPPPAAAPQVRPRRSPAVVVAETAPAAPPAPVEIERVAPALAQGPTTSVILNHVYDRLGKIGEFNPSTVAAAVALAFQKARHLKMDLEKAEGDVTQ